MAEVVGTAFVRIKAITKDLSSDIQKGLEKGIAGVDIDKATKGISTDIAEKVGGEIKTGINKGVKDAATDDSVESSGTDAGKTIRKGIEKGLSDAGGGGGNGNFITRFFKNAFGGDGDNSTSGKAGKKTGNDFFKGFKKTLDSIPAIPAKFLAGIVASPAIGQAAIGLSNVIISLVGQVGLLGEALAGVGVAGGAAFGAVSFAALPLLLAFTTASPVLDDFKKNIGDTAESFKEIGIVTQQRMLPALSQAFAKLKVFIPIFDDLGRSIGDAVSEFSEFFSNLLTSERGISNLKAITATTAVIFRTLLRTIVRVGDILSSLFVAALPAAERFTQLVEDFFARVQVKLFAKGMEGLTDLFNHLFDISILVFGALGDITAGLLNILAIGGETSIPLFDSFREFARNFRDFTTSIEGRNRIAEVFKNAHEIASAFFDVVGEIVKVLFSASLGDQSSTAGIVGALNSIRDAIPGIADTVGGLVTTLKGPLADLASAFGDVLTAFDQVGGLALIINTLAAALEALAKAASLPGVAEVVALMLTLAGVFSVLKSLGIVAIIEGIGGAIATLATAFGAVEGVGFFSALLGAEGLSGVVAVAAPFAAAAAVIAGAIAGIVLLFIHFGTIKDVVAETIADIQTKFNDLVTFFQNGGLDKIGETISNAFTGIDIDKITNLGDAGQKAGSSFVSSLLDQFKTLPGDLVDIIGSSVSDIGSALTQPLKGISDDIGVNLRPLSGIFKNLGELLSSIGGLLSSTLGAAITAFNIALGIMSGIITNITLPVLRTLAKFFDDFLSSGIADFIKSTLSGAFEILGGAIQVVSKFVEAIVQLFSGDFSGALSSFGDVIAGIGNIFSGISDIVLGTLDFIITTLGEIGSSILRFIGEQFAKVPGLIGDALSGLGDIISSAFDVAFDALKDFFKKLPGRLGDLIVKLGPEIAGFLVDALVKAANLAILSLIATFVGVPLLLIGAIKKWGPALLDAIKAAFGVFLDVVSSTNDAVIQFFIDLPGRIVDVLTGSNQLVLDAISGLVSGALTILEGIGTFFVDTLPGMIKNGADAIVGFVGSIPGLISGFVTQISDKAAEIGTGIANGIFNALVGLPSLILGVIQGAAQAIIDTINAALKFMSDHLHFSIPDWIPLIGGKSWDFPEIHIPDIIGKVQAPDIPRGGPFAMGGIITAPTLAMLGEQSRKEVVIPLTRGRDRALDLAQRSGLLDLLGRTGTESVRSGAAAAPLVGVMHNYTVDPIVSADENVRRLRAVSTASGR